MVNFNSKIHKLLQVKLDQYTLSLRGKFKLGRVSNIEKHLTELYVIDPSSIEGLKDKEFFLYHIEKGVCYVFGEEEIPNVLNILFFEGEVKHPLYVYKYIEHLFI